MFLPLAAGLGLLLVGCASPGGPKFSESGDVAATPPPGQSLVFVLRTPTIVDCANKWVVGVNTQHVTFPNGGYYVFTNAPGQLKLTCRLKGNFLTVSPLDLVFDDPKFKEYIRLRLEVQADSVHYVKVFCGYFKELTPAKGKEGLARCERIVPEPPAASGSLPPTTNRTRK